MADDTTSQSTLAPLALPESTDPVALFVTHGLLSPQLPLAAIDEIASLLQQHGEALQTGVVAIIRRYMAYGVN